MPLKTTALALLFLLGASEPRAEDYNYAELTQGIKISHAPWGDSNWNGSCPTAFSFGRHFEATKAVYIRGEFNHTSNICKGAPFEKVDTETWLDQLSITVGVKF